MTRIGNFLRKTSLDELPQLFNVLKGEMSWLARARSSRTSCPAMAAMRLPICVYCPGLTGLWQTTGRNDVSYDERVNDGRSL